jgi:hypothetical protein
MNLIGRRVQRTARKILQFTEIEDKKMGWVKAFLKGVAGLTTLEFGLVVLGIAGMTIASLSLMVPELNTLFMPG